MTHASRRHPGPSGAPRKVASFVVATAIGLGTWLAVGRSATDPAQAAPDAAVAAGETLAPGMQISRIAKGNAVSIAVDVPATADTGLRADVLNGFQAADRRWRGMVAAAVAADGDLAITDGTVTAGDQSDTWTGPMRSAAGESLRAPFPRLGSVDPDAIAKQLDANASVLKAGLPADQNPGFGYRVLPSAGLSTVVIDVHVRDLAKLTGHLADLVLGSSVGLPTGVNAITRAVAVRVTDDAGRAAAAWSVSQIGVGMTLVDPRLSPNSAGGLGQIRWPYVVTTSAPTPLASANGAASQPAIRLTMSGRTRVLRPTWQDCPAGSGCVTHKPPKVSGCLRRSPKVQVGLPSDAQAVYASLQQVRGGVATHSIATVTAAKTRNARNWTATFRPAHVRKAGAVSVSVTFANGPGYTYFVGARRRC